MPVNNQNPQAMFEQVGPWHIALLSGKTPADLEAKVRTLQAQLAASVGVGTSAMIFGDHAEVGSRGHRAALVFFQDGASTAAEITPGEMGTAAQESRAVALMFPGLGDHHVEMGLNLYQGEPTFREHVDHCTELLKREIGLDLRNVIYPARAQAPPRALSAGGATGDLPRQGLDLRRMLGRVREEPTADQALLNRTSIAQPALFVVEYALAKLWQTWGLPIHVMIGYSLGEYVAACLAGVLSLEDSLTLVARRAQLIDKLPSGAMLAVSLSEDELSPLLGDHLSLAAVTGPEFCVAAGPPEAVLELQRRLAARGTACRQVQSSHAFHSKMMDPIADRVTRLVEMYTLRPPQIPYVSNVTGTVITAAQATDPTYWATHMCRPVRFADGLRELLQRPECIFLEVGPGQTLSSLAIQQPRGAASAGRRVVASMRHAHDGQSDVAFLLKALGRLWVAGASLDTSRFPVLSLLGEQGAAVAASAEEVNPDGLAAADACTEPGAEPSTDVEKTLAGLWQTHLLAPRVGRHDDFFSLGGNSLVATRLILQIFKTFRVNLPLRRMYEVRILSAMAAAIEVLLAGKSEKSKSTESGPAS